MGSFIAQELTLTNPEKLDNPILYASGCDDQEAEPPSPEVIQTFSNTSMSPQELGPKIIISIISSRLVQSKSRLPKLLSSAQRISVA